MFAALLDDLDKELNTYSMRCREWYGWHFPEMSKLIPDHDAFAKVVRKMRQRTNAATISLSDILPEEMEEELKQVCAAGACVAVMIWWQSDMGYDGNTYVRLLNIYEEDFNVPEPLAKCYIPMGSSAMVHFLLTLLCISYRRPRSAWAQT